MLPIYTDQIFDASVLERMTPADFKFARQQLQSIYSKEMSKASIIMERKEKVQSNLETQQRMKEQMLKQQQISLFQKLQRAELKRKLLNDKKSRIREIKELKWVEKKERAESVQQKSIIAAEKKQRIINKELEDYLNSKLNKSNTGQKSSFHSPHHNQSDSSFIYESCEKQRLPSIVKPLLSQRQSRQRRKKGMKLNLQIFEHQKKKKRMHEQKQEEILQGYIHRIEGIQRRRDQKRKSKSEQNKKLQPSEYRTAKSREREFRNRESQKPEIYVMRQEKIEDYQRNKNKIDEEEFNQRTDLLESIQKQNLKMTILKQIKKKVNEHKLMAQR